MVPDFGPQKPKGHVVCFGCPVFHWQSTVLIGSSTALIFFQGAVPACADTTNFEQAVQELSKQNLELKAQLEHQTEVLNSLSQKVNELEAANPNPATTGGTAADDAAVPTKGGVNFGNINISGEGGVAFFNTGENGFAPDSDFRVDEARLFVEAPIWKEVYFYSDIDLATRENPGLQLNLNELYLDFQDLSQLWGRDSQLNFRAGRLDIPFGEEYLTRFAIDNPLISHSIADLWGESPGVELYGSLGKFSYVAAVQNAGANGGDVSDGDKSVTGRMGYDLNQHWHFSASAMRTGNLKVNSEDASALWIGNELLHSLGSPATTHFHANLVEGDVTARWRSGHISAAGGYARYDDDDPARNNGCNVFYYSVEGVQNLPKKFFVATRFSQMVADGGGFPIVGYGNFGDYYFDNLSTDLWRLSLGIGYRFSDQLVLKAEYSFEHGREVSGDARNGEDFLGMEAAFKF
jgi:hypothetical protein